MKLLIPLVAMLLIPLHAHAQIEGGFGLKLGDVLAVDSGELEAVGEFGTTLYRVKPPKPLTGFDVYVVSVTPVTHRIYQIKAIRHFNLADAVKTEYEMLKKVLESKYARKGDGRIHQRHRGNEFREDKGPSATFSRGDNSVTITRYDGRDIDRVDVIKDEYKYPRVVITFRSEDYKLMRDEEFRTQYKNQEETNGEKRVEEAESVL